MDNNLNVLGEPLQPCSMNPLTGFYRDGCCKTGEDDRGKHIVCAQMTEDFLNYTKSRGNDLSTAIPQFGFLGLKPGDQWCLCASRWKEALDAGMAPLFGSAQLTKLPWRLFPWTNFSITLSQMID